VRAASSCPVPGCHRTTARGGRCHVHAPQPWQSSQLRRQELGLKGARGVAIKRAVRARAHDRCESCGRAVPRGAGAVDHRVPLAAGGPAGHLGPSGLDNLQLLCDECDGAKLVADRVARAGGGGSPPRDSTDPDGDCGREKKSPRARARGGGK
jgi:5-methylcytosine-specific restriction endonuclease McrA